MLLNFGERLRYGEVKQHPFSSGGDGAWVYKYKHKDTRTCAHTQTHTRMHISIYCKYRTEIFQFPSTKLTKCGLSQIWVTLEYAIPRFRAADMKKE